MKKIKVAKPLTWSQGYHPGPAPSSPRETLQTNHVFAGYKPPARVVHKRYAITIGLGILLLVGGSWLLAQPLVASATRQRTDADLRAVYYAAVSQEAESTPSVTVAATLQPTAEPAQAAATLARTFATASPMRSYGTRDRFLSLIHTNRDIVGWLTIQDLIDLPVVQRDNAYYLTHDFLGKVSYSGTLFLDQNFSIVPPHQNFLIHGHNMRDGSMFGQLLKYRTKSFYIKHWLIRFETLYEEGSYVVFAVFTMVNDPSSPDYFPYSYAQFDTDLQFEDYIANVKKRSLFQNDLSILPTDTLLTLSTCAGGDHHYWVVMARKVRDGENMSDITAACLMSAF